MRDMNDDLIVRILVRTAVFISIWVSSTSFAGKTGGVSDAMCIGVLNDYQIQMNSKISPDKLPQPYAWMFWSLLVANLFFMASAKIGRHQRNSLDDDTRFEYLEALIRISHAVQDLGQLQAMSKSFQKLVFQPSPNN